MSLLVLAAAHADESTLTFHLKADPQAIALQFDVTSSVPGLTLSEPKFLGASPHAVEFAVLSSGATRFVAYTTTGQAISDTGQVEVTFSSPELREGILSVSGVVASSATGGLLPASPNAAPVVIPNSPAYFSAQVGAPAQISFTAYDLDGTIASVNFNEGGSQFASSASFTPATTNWLPGSTGTFFFSATAIDNLGATTTASLGEVRAYLPSELATFADYESIHFGAAANPSDLGFGTQPFGHGIANGLAWLLGINPNSPDLSTLPQGSVETNGVGQEFVFRFNALANHPGAAWDVLETPDLTAGSWDAVPLSSITETPRGDGTVDVEVRKPIDPITDPKAFLALEVSETE